MNKDEPGVTLSVHGNASRRTITAILSAGALAGSLGTATCFISGSAADIAADLDSCTRSEDRLSEQVIKYESFIDRASAEVPAVKRLAESADLPYRYALPGGIRQ